MRSINVNNDLTFSKFHFTPCKHMNTLFSSAVLCKVVELPKEVVKTKHVVSSKWIQCFITTKRTFSCNNCPNSSFLVTVLSLLKINSDVPICIHHPCKICPLSNPWMAQLSITMKSLNSRARLPFEFEALPASPKKIKNWVEFEAPCTVFAHSTPSKPHSRLSVILAPFWLPRITLLAGVPLRELSYTELPISQ